LKEQLVLSLGNITYSTKLIHEEIKYKN